MNYSFLISDIISMQKPWSFKWKDYKISMEEKNQKALHNSLVSHWSFMAFLYLYEYFSFAKLLRLLRTCDFSPIMDFKFNTQTYACILTVPNGATWWGASQSKQSSSSSMVTRRVSVWVAEIILFIQHFFLDVWI